MKFPQWTQLAPLFAFLFLNYLSAQTAVNGTRVFVGGVEEGLASYTRPQTGSGAPAPAACNNAKAISSSTSATPIVVTSASHGFVNGQVITVYGHLVNTNADGTWMAGSVTANNFALCGYWDGATCQNPAVGNGVGVGTGFASSQVGRIYMRTDAVSAAQSIYVCTDTSGGSPGWTLQAPANSYASVLSYGASVAGAASNGAFQSALNDCGTKFNLLHIPSGIGLSSTGPLGATYNIAGSPLVWGQGVCRVVVERGAGLNQALPPSDNEHTIVYDDLAPFNPFTTGSGSSCYTDNSSKGICIGYDPVGGLSGIFAPPAVKATTSTEIYAQDAQQGALNASGGKLIIGSGRPTGSANGSILFQLAPSGPSGTTYNTRVNEWQMFGNVFSCVTDLACQFGTPSFRPNIDVNNTVIEGLITDKGSACYLTANLAATNSATPVNVCAGWPISANKSYSLHCMLTVTYVTSATVGLQLSGPGSPAHWSMTYIGNTGAAAALESKNSQGATSYAPLTTGAPGNVTEVIAFDAGVTNGTTASGTNLTLQTIGNGTNNYNILKDSYCHLQQLN